MKKLLLFLLIIQSICASAKLEYPSDSISPRLTKGMNAVVREYNCNLSIIGNNSQEKTKFVVTILNASGLSTAEFFNSYDKYSAIKIKSIVYIDSKGKTIRRVTNSEIKDYCEYNYATLASDVRFKLFQPNIYHYPFTIKMEYVENKKESFSYNSWSPYWGESVSVENAQYTVQYDSSTHINQKNFNIEIARQWKDKKDNWNLNWKLENYIPLKDNIFMPNYSEYIPTVLIQQREFTIGKYKGNASNWESLGNFMYSLTQQDNTLSEKTIQDLKSINNNYIITKEKIQKVYEYMQSHTRYVNIKFGLGGLIPLPSQLVDKNGWGDCKALSNYTKRLLQEIGIESHVAIINAGSRAQSIITDFSSSQFNHVILCVPNNKDTVWLECTSQTNPFGFMSDFTDNRYCLVLKEHDSYLTKTPKLNDFTNKEINNCIVELKTNGNSTLSTLSLISGLDYSTYENVNQYNNEDKIKYLSKIFQIPSYKLKTYSLELIKSENPLAKLHCDIDIQQIGSSMNGSIIFKASLVNKFTVQFVDQERKCNILIRRGSETIDTITYIVPENFDIKVLPEKKCINSLWGSYSITCEKIQNTIRYVRHFVLLSGYYSQEKYPDLKKYLIEVEQYDNSKIILAQKNM